MIPIKFLIPSFLLVLSVPSIQSLTTADIKKAHNVFKRTNGFNGKNPCRGFTALLREELGGTWVCVSGVTIGYSFTVGQFTDNSKFTFEEPNSKYKKTIKYAVFQNNPKFSTKNTKPKTTTKATTTQAPENDDESVTESTTTADPMYNKDGDDDY